MSFFSFHKDLTIYINYFLLICFRNSTLMKCKDMASPPTRSVFYAEVIYSDSDQDSWNIHMLTFTR